MPDGNPLDSLPPEIQKLARQGLASHGLDSEGNMMAEIKLSAAAERYRQLAERLESPESGLNVLRDEIHMTALNHNWWSRPKSFGECLMLVVSEAAEAIEEYRDNHPFDEVYWVKESPEATKETKPCGIPTELADIIIRVLDMCGYWGVDIEEAMRIKMTYNRTRPERHGGKLY